MPAIALERRKDPPRQRGTLPRDRGPEPPEVFDRGFEHLDGGLRAAMDPRQYGGGEADDVPHVLRRQARIALGEGTGDRDPKMIDLLRQLPPLFPIQKRARTSDRVDALSERDGELVAAVERRQGDRQLAPEDRVRASVFVEDLREAPNAEPLELVGGDLLCPCHGPNGITTSGRERQIAGCSSQHAGSGRSSLSSAPIGPPCEERTR